MELTLRSQVGVVWSVAFSPDGRLIATGGGEPVEGPGELKVWDARTGQPDWVPGPPEKHTGGVISIAFSPDGRLLASAANNGMVKVYDVGSRLEILNCQGQGSPSRAFSVAFSPDGRSLASAGVQTVTIWRVATGEEIQVLDGHVGQVLQAVFHPKEDRLATAGYDGTVKIWDVRSGQEVLTLRGHRGPVSDVAFSPDGRQIVSASRDGTVRIWDATPWSEPRAGTVPGMQPGASL
jgi:WD40 repeat protein